MSEEKILQEAPKEEAPKEAILQEAPKQKRGRKPRPIYLVVHAIKEDGHLYTKGDVYKGNYPQRFLKGGQIRIR